MMCLKSDNDSIKIASEYLKNQKVVILPTDTVYGFSGLVGKTDARIREIKGREETKPFIQLISSPSQISLITDDKIPQKLLDYWPGPLTIIVKDKPDSSKTIAVRCPGDQWLRSVIEKCGGPIYSTSVNRSGSPVLEKIADIKNEFEKEVDLIVDNGNSKSGVPSTIVALTQDGGYKVIRTGAVQL